MGLPCVWRWPLLAEPIEDILVIADALSKLASVTNSPARSADAAIKMAKPDQMNRLPTNEVLSVPERNDRVGAFVTLRLRHTVRHKTRSWKSGGSTLDHRRYVTAQVMAARSEAAWTPIRPSEEREIFSL